MLPSIPHAFATTAEFWCVNRWCKGSYESKDNKKSIFLTLLNEVKPLVLIFSEIHDWVTTFGMFFLTVQVFAAMSASVWIRSGCGARLRKAGKEAGWSNYFFPIFRCFQKLITRQLHAGNTARSLTQKYASIKLGKFAFQFWPCLFVMHCWERGDPWIPR